MIKVKNLTAQIIVKQMRTVKIRECGRGRIAYILKQYFAINKKRSVIYLTSRKFTAYGYPWARKLAGDLIGGGRFFSRVDCRLGANLSVISGLLCVFRGLNSSNQSGTTNQNAEPPNDPRCDGGYLSGIRSLPLGAQVGFAMIFAAAAWGCGYIGFDRLLERRINALQSFSYLALSLGVFADGILPFWWAGS